MAQDNLTRTPSSPWTKAFRRNVQQDRYNPVLVTVTQPGQPGPQTSGPAAPAGDGVVNVGLTGNFGAQRIVLQPFCEGQPGQAFGMAVYGWRSLAPATRQGPVLWLWHVLAEFLCVAGDVPGPVLDNNNPWANPDLALGRLENLCVGLALTAGVLGATGFVNSGSGGPAVAGVELQGCQLVSFDFAHPRQRPVGANCLWALA